MSSSISPEFLRRLEAKKQRSVGAFRTFEISKSLGELKEALDREGPWVWKCYISNRYGECVTTKPLPSPHYSFVRIFRDEGQLYLSAAMRGDLDVPAETAQKLGREALETLFRVLAAAGVTNVRPAEHFEL